MSRMVRENQVSGLRERLFFAQSLLRQLSEDQAHAAIGIRLALRGAVVFHLYSVLVGLCRQSAKTYAIPGYDACLSLASLASAFAAADVDAPEIALIQQARCDNKDPIAWLDQQMAIAMGASGLARRPTPPQDNNALNLLNEDRYAPLADGDLQRLQDCCQRVSKIIELCATYMEEW